MSVCADRSELRERSQAVLASKLGNIKKVALAAALVPLAMAAASPASAENSVRVKANVTQAGAKYVYEFTVVNTSDVGASGGTGAQANPGADPTAAAAAAPTGGPSRPWIINWELPIFDAADVTDVKCPEGWGYEIVKPTDTSPYYNNDKGPYGKYGWTWKATEDPTLKLKKQADAKVYGQNPAAFAKPAFVIHWYAKHQADAKGANMPVKPIGALDSMKGFGFTSGHTSTTAPFMASWYRISTLKAEPMIGKGVIPASPAYQKAQATVVSALPAQ